jgi:MutS domain V
MKVHLAFRDRDLDLDFGADLPPNTEDLVQDLGLDLVLGAMAAGQRSLYEVARATVLRSLDDTEAIRYRQAVLADCLEQPDLVRELHSLAEEAIERERRIWGFTPRYPRSLLHRSVDVLGMFREVLGRLRTIADANATTFRSEGFRRLLEEVVRELDDDYLREVDEHLERLQFQDGVAVSARLGEANRGTDYVLRRRVGRPSWRERIGLGEPDSLVWELPERDQAGAQALEELEGRGIALAAVALAESTDHILSYFAQLRAELGFYVGCLNLHDLLSGKGEPTCMPAAAAPGSNILGARDLYDPGLSLALGEARAVGNDLEADGRSLLVVTGANRGGKSTFLRSLGLAQLLMQAGMFVSATSFRADVRAGMFTHFKREEDVTLRSGKLDEELQRMSAIVDATPPNALILLNESFASTNEREGSEIARQIVRALGEAGIKVAYVTHLYDLASGLHAERSEDALFLRAERLEDGRRTFRLVEGEPLPTSHGQDIYQQVLGDQPMASSAPAGGSSTAGL